MHLILMRVAVHLILVRVAERTTAPTTDGYFEGESNLGGETEALEDTSSMDKDQSWDQSASLDLEILGHQDCACRAKEHREGWVASKPTTPQDPPSQSDH
jgi:hypothetical protein